MKQSTVSVRGQTVIPQEIRDQLGIKCGTKLVWWPRNGVITVVPIPEDPVLASIGVLRGKGPTTDDLLTERRRDLELEEEKLKPWLKKERP